MKVMLCGDNHDLCCFLAATMAKLENFSSLVVMHVPEATLLDDIYQQRPEILLLHFAAGKLAAITQALEAKACSSIALATFITPAVIAIGAAQACGAWVFALGIDHYLPLPISACALADALLRVSRPNAAQWRTIEQQSALAQCTDGEHLTLPNAAQQFSARKHIAARTHRGMEMIALHDVYYFAADQKYVKVRHKDGAVLIDETLKALEQEFTHKHKIVRIHRNALINLNHLELLEMLEVGRYQVRFRGIQDVLLVSRRHLLALRQHLVRL